METIILYRHGDSKTLVVDLFDSISVWVSLSPLHEVSSLTVFQTHDLSALQDASSLKSAHLASGAMNDNTSCMKRTAVSAPQLMNPMIRSRHDLRTSDNCVFFVFVRKSRDTISLKLKFS
jgi:hypothetical protein